MKKVAIGIGALVLISAIVFFTVKAQGNAPAVQTGIANKQDLVTIVSASGEIKPKTYVNLGANAFGKIVRLYVKEGDRVKQGQMVAQLENVQPAADVAAQRAGVTANTTDAQAAVAGLHTSEADLNRARADAERTKLDYDRADGLYKDQLISKADYDMRKDPVVPS